MYKIHLYGQIWNYDGSNCYVDETPFETPQFDLQDKKAIERIVKIRYPNCKDASGVQVFFHEQFDPSTRAEREASETKHEEDKPKKKLFGGGGGGSKSKRPSTLTGWIFAIIWWIIKLPFKLIWWLFK